MTRPLHVCDRCEAVTAHVTLILATGQRWCSRCARNRPVMATTGNARAAAETHDQGELELGEVRS